MYRRIALPYAAGSVELVLNVQDPEISEVDMDSLLGNQIQTVVTVVVPALNQFVTSDSFQEPTKATGQSTLTINDTAVELVVTITSNSGATSSDLACLVTHTLSGLLNTFDQIDQLKAYNAAMAAKKSTGPLFTFVGDVLRSFMHSPFPGSSTDGSFVAAYIVDPTGRTTPQYSAYDQSSGTFVNPDGSTEQYGNIYDGIVTGAFPFGYTHQ